MRLIRLKGLLADGKWAYETLPPWRKTSRKSFKLVVSVTAQ